VVDILYNDITTFSTPTYRFDLNGVFADNYKKGYSNGLTLSRENFLNSIIDKKVKSGSIFYLTSETPHQTQFKTKSSQYNSKILTSSLESNGKFLNFVNLETNNFALSGDYDTYDKILRCVFDSEEVPINIRFNSETKCTLHVEKNNKIFNLKINDDLTCIVSTLDNATELNYSFSSNFDKLYLKVSVNSNDYFLMNKGNDLILQVLTENNKYLLISQGFKLSKSITIDSHYPKNNKICNYSNNLDVDTSEETENNYLIHRTDELVSILTLKNTFTQNVTNTSTNNLLSSTSKFKSNGTKYYTSINLDVSRYYDDELTLNYVFGNMEYVIKPGKNIISTPETLYPYDQLNVNDTLFIKSGAYPSNSPEYADKIYKMNEVSLENGQHYLCTWLSGNSTNSTWVDRYYYPDLISKEVALSSIGFFQPTYNDPIEILINNNLTLRESVIDNSFFDKRSDMCFKPSEQYIYDRLNINEELDNIVKPFDPCDTPLNYFKDINSSGTFQISFYFKDGSDWALFSKRNNIDGGVKITKNGQMLVFEFNLYNPTTNNYIKFKKDAPFKNSAKNFVAISVDTLNGVGYFYLNSEIIEHFKFPHAQFVNKSILFGDIDNISNIENLRISPSYIRPEDLVKYKIFDDIVEINEIVISLPCGTRNGVDEMKYLQNVCKASASKSDTININVYNTGLKSEDVENLKPGLMEVISNNKSLTLNVENLEIT
jgi:hypothetical protein